MKILLGMPSCGGIPMQTVTSLEAMLRSRECVDPIHVENSLVYTARDFICEYAVEKGFDYVLMVDSDMVFKPTDLDILFKTMKETGADVVSGTYVTRVGEPRIVAYSKVNKRQQRPFKSPDMKNVELYSVEAVEEVEAVGMGFCLIKTELLKKMFRDYVSLFEPRWGVGEDVAFCIRARAYTKIMLSRTVKLGHLGQRVNNVPLMSVEEQIKSKSSTL